MAGMIIPHQWGCFLIWGSPIRIAMSGVLYVKCHFCGFFKLSLGVGTFPLIWVISFRAQHLYIKMGSKSSAIYPEITGIIAALLIIRGFGSKFPI